MMSSIEFASEPQEARANVILAGFSSEPGVGVSAAISELANCYGTSGQSVLIVDATPDGHALLGAPFRSTHKTVFRKGRWPLAAVLFPDHGPSPRLSSVPSIVAKARIAANLTFVADAVQSDDRISCLIEDLATRTPCAQLTFAPDPGFVDTLRAWPGSA